MVEMTQTLVDKGHAYEADGHVLFDVTTYERYGALARRSLDDMVAGSRVEVAPYKKNPMDFVLWKPSTDEQPGWDSPWGRGRPGWHIECSAMAGTLFGPVFDIHGGGIDLQFPHHENEVAQSCCANDTDLMANVWMHNGFLQVEGEKMAKSLGNFFTVKDLRDRGIPGEVIRFVLLSAHYRQPLDWTDAKVKEAETVLRHLRQLTLGVESSAPSPELIAAISDDLNSPKAIAILHKLRNDVMHGRGDRSVLRASGVILGILDDNLADWFERPPKTENVPDEALDQIRLAWANARAVKDYSTADEIRSRANDLDLKLTANPAASEGASIEHPQAFSDAWVNSVEELAEALR